MASSADSGRYLTYSDGTSYDYNRRFPTENYAHEVQQLFTIGLDMLNPDGTAKSDDQGNALPTYRTKHIQHSGNGRLFQRLLVVLVLLFQTSVKRVLTSAVPMATATVSCLHSAISTRQHGMWTRAVASARVLSPCIWSPGMRTF